MQINQKSKNKTRNCRQQKRKKQTNKHKKERNISFRWMSYVWALHVQLEHVVNSWHRLPKVQFSLKLVVPFINITETITLRSSSLEPLSKYTCIRLF